MGSKRRNCEQVVQRSRGAPSDSFNLGNGSGFSVKEVIHAAQRVTCKTIKTIAAERRPGDPPFLIGSADKAKKILKWQPEYPNLNEIIKTAWLWHANKIFPSKT
jgi:UDP-glucose 4-epimerase